MVAHRKGPPTDALIEEYESGRTTVELGLKYGMTPSGVNGRLRRAGVTLREAARRTCYNNDPKFVADVVAEYRSGKTAMEIAIRRGVGMSTIQRAIVRGGVTLRRNGTRSRTITLPTDPLKIGYLAGLFDGEGNIQFRTKTIKGRESTGCKVAIYQTIPATMGWLKSTVGGAVRWDYKRQERHGWLPCGIWELYRAQDVLAFLILVEPLLTAKKKQAVKAIKFLKIKCCHHDSPPTITQSN